MKILCDTNSITALRLGNSMVLKSLEEAELVFLSVIVLGELLYGYKNGTKERENLIFLDTLIAKPRVKMLPITAETAKVYADLRLELKRLGQPIPTNDLWIASQAIESGTVLLSNDEHFRHILGLRRNRF